MNLKNLIFLVLLSMIYKGDIYAQRWKKYMGEIGEKKLKYEDWVYEDYIRTVKLYNSITNNDGLPTAPIISLNAQGNLILEFDDIIEDSEDYYAKIIHCNHDWKESGYRPIEYLNTYNEFNINDFEFSISTKVPYVHYTFKVPNVKLSGNYLLIVYRGGDEDDLIITRRFVVYEEGVQISAKVVDMIGSTASINMQQINFSVFHGGVRLEIPSENVFATIRQNYRWENAINELKPLFVKPNNSELDFSYFNKENAFMGGNEFRYFDSGYKYAGLNIMDVQREDDINILYLNHDKSRSDRVYNSQKVQRDINGRFIIGAQAGNAEASIEADYNEVNFVLESDNPYDGDVYVIGSFNDWKLKEENKLVYDTSTGSYKGALLLKQGRYDYMYAIYKDNMLNERIIENSFNLTENEYDIIIYYKPLAGRGDRVIGYQPISINK